MATAKLILFDLDGTLYFDGVLYPGVPELIQRLWESPKLEYCFLTNNSSIGPGDYYQKLQRLGLPLDPRNVASSCEATALMLKSLGVGPEIYILGTKKFRDYMESQGFIHTFQGAKALLLGFDQELDYKKLTEATQLVLQDYPVYASHPDPVCPGPVPLPDIGMLIAYFRAAKPGFVLRGIAGKPHKWIMRLVSERFGVKPEEMVMVGDRVGTDMQFAANFGMRSMLALNGVPMPALGDIRPTVVVERIDQMNHELWPEALGWC